MLRDSVTVEQAIELLNSALEADPIAIQNLMNSRVTCNDDLANHPTIQVGSDGVGEDSPFRVGLLGIVNGLFGTWNSNGYGAIHAECMSDGTIVTFARTSGREKGK